VLTQILAHGHVRRGKLGLAGQTVPLPQRLRHSLGLTQPSAVLVAEVIPDGPAARSGIATASLILALDGQPVTGVDDLVRLLDASRIGRPVEIKVLHDHKLVLKSVVPEQRND
jgi:S1-C subfamily serine protease